MTELDIEEPGHVGEDVRNVLPEMGAESRLIV